MEENEISAAFEEYELLKIQSKKIDDRIDELKSTIVSYMPPDGEQVTGAHGVFRLQQKTTWKFSSELEDIKKDVKKKEAEEKAKGIATGETTDVLIYTVNK